MKKRMRVMAMILAAALCVSSTPFSVYAEEMETEVVTESAESVIDEMTAEQVEDNEGETEANKEADEEFEVEIEKEANVEAETETKQEVDIEVESEVESVSKDATMAQIYNSGTCGENLTWTCDVEGTLIISGNGEMEESNQFRDLYINKVVIEEGVTSISNGAFMGNSSLETLVLPKTLEVIGVHASESCYGLKDVYYAGTQEEWNNIKIDSHCNEGILIYATIHCQISVVIEEGPEISEMTYLAMSDAAYYSGFRKYALRIEGEKKSTEKEHSEYNSLGELANGENVDFFKKIRSKNIKNSNISSDMNLTWGHVYAQCLSSWRVAEVYQSLNTGLYATIFERPATNQVVISFRGSQELSLDQEDPGFVDWVVDDLLMQMNENTPQIEEAVKLAKYYVNESKYKSSNISFTGHSLGGGLAILAANATNKEAVPFDSAPTVDVGYYYMWDKMGDAFKGIDKWTFQDHLNELCPVGNLEIIPKCKKNYIKYKNLLDTVLKPLDVHDRYTIVTFNNGKFDLSEAVGNKKFTKTDKWKNAIDKGLLFGSLTIHSGTLSLGTSINNTINGIPGSIHTDVVYGGEGVDCLNGYQGDDYLIGGPGDDKLDGNTGNDTYVYFKDQGKDTITDYQGNDIIKLYGFSDSDTIECENLNDSATHCCITCNGERIINISKNRSLNPLNSFKVEVMDDAGNVKKEVKIQDWNTWKNVRTYKIACPVNVEIYDADNNLVMTLEDGVEDTIYTEYGNFYCAFNEETNEYDKMVDLVSDYSIKIVGNNDGNMDVSVFETDETGKETEYAANDIPVSNQEIFAIDDNAKKLVSDKQEVELSEVKNDTEETDTDDNKEDAGKDKKDSAQNTGTNTGSTVTTKPAASGSASATVSAPAVTKLKKVKAGKKKATLKWKKVSGATGYEIQYGTKKNFKKAKTKTIKKAKTVKSTIKKLKAGKKYYFRIRTYKTVNGKKYYSAWSKVKKVKIK